MHVTVDGRGTDDWTGKTVEDWLNRCITHFGLMCLGGPIVKNFQGHVTGHGTFGDGGHIHGSIHYGKNKANLELNSSQWFSVPEFVEICTEMFGLEKPRVQKISREVDGGGA